MRVGDRWGAEPPVEEPPYPEVADRLHPLPVGTPSTPPVRTDGKVPLYVGLGLLAFFLLTSGRG